MTIIDATGRIVITDVFLNAALMAKGEYPADIYAQVSDGDGQVYICSAYELTPIVLETSFEHFKRRLAMFKRSVVAQCSDTL